MLELWYFIEKQILGMKWLNELIGNVLNGLGVNIEGKIGGGLQFFIYDTIKIVVLLGILIFLISYIQSYFTPEKSKKIIGKFKGVKGNIIAALLGTVTPFCSCSSIPIFMGFRNSGLPLGITFSFLISSPMVDIASLILLMSIFGTRVAVIYVVVGLVIAVVGGIVIEKIGVDEYEGESVSDIDTVREDYTKKERIEYAKKQVIYTFKKVLIYIIIGVGIGAFIHNWIPESWINNILGENNPFGVIFAVILGTPMYADIFGTIPVAEALLYKGAQLGTVLSFLMAVTTLSLPSIIMLSKVIKPKLMIVFIAICLVGIIVVGYLFNIYQYLYI